MLKLKVQCRHKNGNIIDLFGKCLWNTFTEIHLEHFFFFLLMVLAAAEEDTITTGGMKSFSFG